MFDKRGLQLAYTEEIFWCDFLLNQTLLPVAHLVLHYNAVQIPDNFAQHLIFAMRQIDAHSIPCHKSARTMHKILTFPTSCPRSQYRFVWGHTDVILALKNVKLTLTFLLHFWSSIFMSVPHSMCSDPDRREPEFCIVSLMDLPSNR